MKPTVIQKERQKQIKALPKTQKKRAGTPAQKVADNRRKRQIKEIMLSKPKPKRK